MYRFVMYHFVTYHFLTYRFVTYRFVTYRFVMYRVATYRFVTYRYVTYHYVITPWMCSYEIKTDQLQSPAPNLRWPALPPTSTPRDETGDNRVIHPSVPSPPSPLPSWDTCQTKTSVPRDKIATKLLRPVTKLVTKLLFSSLLSTSLPTALKVKHHQSHCSPNLRYSDYVIVGSDKLLSINPIQ